MRKQTADLLLQAIDDAFQIAADNQARIRAFELALEQHGPAQYRAYLEALEDLKRNSAFTTNKMLAGNLKSALLQE